MAKQKFKVGDVVRWYWPSNPKLVLGWQKKFGHGPFIVTGARDRAVYMNRLSDGGSANTDHYQGSGFHEQVLAKDEFLTAAYRAKQQCQKKTPSE